MMICRVLRFGVMLGATILVADAVRAQDLLQHRETPAATDWITPVSHRAEMPCGVCGDTQDAVCGSGCGVSTDRPPQSFCERTRMTGDWCGTRTRLEDCGVIYEGRITQFFMGISGGVQDPVPARLQRFGIGGGDTFEYTGTSQHDFQLQLEKLLGGPPASQVRISLENIWGRFGNVSLESGAIAPPIFNAFMPNDLDAEGEPRLTNFMYVQPLSERLILTGGKAKLPGLADQDIFAGGDGTDQFLNQVFSANPLYVGALPISSFVFGAIMPREWGAVSITLIDPVERSTEGLEVGEMFSQGAILASEIKVKTNFFDMPGEHHVGGMYKRIDQLDLQFAVVPPTYPPAPAPPGAPAFAKIENAYTLYYGFDQYLRTFGEADGRGNAGGWGLFGRAGLADDGTGNPNFSAWHVSLGIGGDSPLRKGKGDRFGIGYAYTGTSTEWGPLPTLLFAPRDYQAVEAYYKYRVTPSLSVSPDLQWVRGTLSRLTRGDDAFIYGLRVNVRL